jgi:hypothetical protein
MYVYYGKQALADQNPNIVREHILLFIPEINRKVAYVCMIFAE